MVNIEIKTAFIDFIHRVTEATVVAVRLIGEGVKDLMGALVKLLYIAAYAAAVLCPIVWLGSGGWGQILKTIGVSGEQEGSINTDDCREHVFLKEGSPETRYRKFTCAYLRSNSGKLISGFCESVELEGKTCKTVYKYEKKPWTTCPAHSSLNVDDRCWAEPGYHWLPGGREVAADPPPQASNGGSIDYEALANQARQEPSKPSNELYKPPDSVPEDTSGK